MCTFEGEFLNKNGDQISKAEIGTTKSWALDHTSNFKNQHKVGRVWEVYGKISKEILPSIHLRLRTHIGHFRASLVRRAEIGYF